jgi:Lrp/AsnC family leucine-responsive transcriptional regulator
LSNKIADVDEVDRSILAVLEKHGRISNADLAAAVGLSPSPCLRRVRRLEETGVIRGYRALIDPAAAGRSLRVFVAVRLMRHARADVAAFERAVIQLAARSGLQPSHHRQLRLPAPKSLSADTA